MNTAAMERPSQIEYATITVAYVNAPKPGQKSASIKDTDGVYYWIKPADMPNYVPGVAYEISYTTTQSNGYTNRTIKSAEAQRQALPPQQSAPPRSQPAGQAPGNTQRSAPMNQHVPPPQNSTPAPQNNNGNGGGYYRPTSPKDSRRMFICSQMNALIQSHQIAPLNAQSIADAIAMLAEAYDATLGQDDAAT